MSDSLPHTRPSDAEKAAVWATYRKRKPTRVPVMLGTNVRLALVNPNYNPEGYTFEQMDNDPQVQVEMQLRFGLFNRREINPFCDGPTELPEVWEIGLEVYNIPEAAMFGAPIHYYPGQIPGIEPYVDESSKNDIFKQDIEHPLENPYIKNRLAFLAEMERIAKDKKFEGRPVRVLPLILCGSDGMVTAGCNMRGTDFLTEMVEDPEYVHRLLDFIVQAADIRRKAFWKLYGDRVPRTAHMGDDSAAMLSPAMYREMVLPHHRRYYELIGDASIPRSIHLCGNATHLFPILSQDCGVQSFDTGFPVDFASMRHKLGPDVEMLGGPEVSLLLHSTPAQVHQRVRGILQSGVLRGGRFVLREGNNLPPDVPKANLAAMYAAALEFGTYPLQEN